MGIMDRFERKLEGALGDAFARVFGGKVVRQEVEQALQREVADGVRQLDGGHWLAPNSFTVTLSRSDHAQLAGDRQEVSDVLVRWLTQHIAERRWQTYGAVVVRWETSPALHTGQFRTSSTIDPDASHDSPSHPGVAAMNPTPGPDQPPGPGGPRPNNGATWDPYNGWSQHPQGGGWYPTGGPQQPAGQQGGYPAGAPQPYHEQGYDDQGYQPDYYNQGYYEQGYREQGGWDAAPARDLAGSLHLEDGSGRSYQLKQGVNVVGRGQDAQFRLADIGVSRRHLEITWDGQVAMLTDLGSTNGTKVNGSPVQHWQLADGDVVRAGNADIVVRIQG